MSCCRTVLVCALLLTAPGVGAAQGQPVANDLYGDPLPPGALARLGTVRYRHDTTIVFAAFLPDGKSGISVSLDGVLCAWQFPSGKQIRRVEMLTGGSAQIIGATLSPDGKHL